MKAEIHLYFVGITDAHREGSYIGTDGPLNSYTQNKRKYIQGVGVNILYGVLKCNDFSCN